MSKQPDISTLRDHPIRCARPRSTIYAQGDYRVLQHIPRSRGEVGMAIPAQRTDTLHTTDHWMHDDQRRGNVGALATLFAEWIRTNAWNHSQVVALFDTLYMRLLGICFASFSSGESLLIYPRRPPNSSAHSCSNSCFLRRELPLPSRPLFPCSLNVSPPHLPASPTSLRCTRSGSFKPDF